MHIHQESYQATALLQTVNKPNENQVSSTSGSLLILSYLPVNLSFSNLFPLHFHHGLQWYSCTMLLKREQRKVIAFWQALFWVQTKKTANSFLHNMLLSYDQLEASKECNSGLWILAKKQEAKDGISHIHICPPKDVLHSTTQNRPLFRIWQICADLWLEIERSLEFTFCSKPPFNSHMNIEVFHALVLLATITVDFPIICENIHEL